MVSRDARFWMLLKFPHAAKRAPRRPRPLSRALRLRRHRGAVAPRLSRRGVMVRPASPGVNPRSPTRADQERLKCQAEKLAAAQKAKAERSQRESLLEARQAARCAQVHDLATQLRTSTASAVAAQAAEVHRQRHGAAGSVKQTQADLRAQRERQLHDFACHGANLNERAAATKRAVKSARGDVRDANLSLAQAKSKQTADLLKQGAEAQAAISNGKREMAERVRREAGLNVVRSALSRAGNERASSASAVRKRSEQDLLHAELERVREAEARKAAADRVELVASPGKVKELKEEEAQRKRAQTGAMRKQCQAFESLALERRAAEAEQRQKMHDAVVCARYGMPTPGV